VILVDGRAGSKELVKPLLALGLPVEETTLDYGDLCFSGRGEKGTPLMIGIEHKKLPDLLQSLTSGRLAGHQMLGMLDTYDRGWLIIEGDWHNDSSGKVTMWKGRGKRASVKGAPPAVELEKRILCLETRGGFRVRICPTRKDTLRFLTALYRFWTDVDLDQHRSHLALHSPDLDRQLLVPISLKRQLAAQLPGIGYTRSQAVDRHFKSIWEMVNAPAEAWREIEGIGPKLAGQIVQALRDRAS
jgi:ERCC4-type nuclease